nr:hypothetical protein [Tanacetum cinerariifolium]
QVTAPVYFEPSGSRGDKSISHEMLLFDAILAIRRHGDKMGLVLSSSFMKGGVVGVVSVQDLSLGVIDY